MSHFLVDDIPRRALVDLNEHMIPDLSNLVMSYINTPFDHVLGQFNNTLTRANRYIDNSHPIIQIIPRDLLIPNYIFLSNACDNKSQVCLDKAIAKSVSLINVLLHLFEGNYEITFNVEIRYDGSWCIPEIDLRSLNE